MQIYSTWFVPTLFVKQIGEWPIVQCWLQSPSVISALEKSRVLKKKGVKSRAPEIRIWDIWIVIPIANLKQYYKYIDIFIDIYMYICI